MGTIEFVISGEYFVGRFLEKDVCLCVQGVTSFFHRELGLKCPLRLWVTIHRKPGPHRWSLSRWGYGWFVDEDYPLDGPEDLVLDGLPERNYYVSIEYA